MKLGTRIRVLLCLALLIAAVAVVFLVLNRRAPVPTPSAPQSEPAQFVSAEPEPIKIGTNFNEVLPDRGGPDGYIGSAACQECHPKQHASWHRSYHRTMTQVVGTNSVVADFNNVTMDYMGERFTLSRKGDEFWVRIEDIAAASGAPEATDSGPPLDIRLSLVTGSHHMQVFWLPAGFGNVQVGFPFTWLIEEARWVPRHDAFIRDADAPPVKEVWNLTCIRCHTTGGRPRPDAERELFHTDVAELGISCEACHGPAEQHVRLERQLAANSTAARPPSTEIVNPSELDHIRSSQICGFCHSVKWFDENEPWKLEGFQFRPGDDLEETTPIVRPRQIEKQPWLGRVLEKAPDLLNDFFWPDGVVRVAGREFNGLLESACFQQGQMSCLSCHSMHYYEQPSDQLARSMETNASCLQCHQAIGADISRHTRHAPDSSGSLCYNCHMPHTSYALMKAIRGHEIESPNVQVTIDSGRPNGCNQCHLDQTLKWTADHLTEWYGQPKPELTDEQENVSASILWLLKGDAGQRALAAWTMGWQPAQQVSGDTWQAAHLARLLDDPYSAVRYIAQRSLRALPGYSDLKYDYVGPPELRAAVQQQVLKTFSQRPPQIDSAKAGRVLLNADGSLDIERAGRLHEQRNDRPMRLRE